MKTDKSGAMISGASVRILWTEIGGKHTEYGRAPETLIEEKAGVYATSETLHGDERGGRVYP